MVALMRIFLSLVLAITLVHPVAQADAAIFGSRETAYQDLSYFPKWTGMIARSLTGEIGTRTSPKKRSICKRNPRFACPEEEWKTFIAAMKSQQIAGPALLRRVNQHLNRAAYVQDPINWGVPDFWAHALEFLQRNGDCEDYAISKYATLKRLGVPTQSMRVVVLEDLNLDLAHAVLSVEMEGTWYILDNQIRTVLPDDAIVHYQPVYSINEHGWWMHRSSGSALPGR